MEERGGSAGWAWCSKKSVSKAKRVNKKRKRDANGGRSRRRHRGGRSCMHRVREARIWRTLAFEAREGWQWSQGHDEGHTVTIGTRSPDRVHQKCPEGGAGVSRVVYCIDLVCWVHEASEDGSQHECRQQKKSQVEGTAGRCEQFGSGCST